MKNNKGQVLITFVLLIPLLLIIMGFVIDFGLISLNKSKIDKIIDNALEYASNNISDTNLKDKLNLMINNDIKNISKLEIEINDEISIHIVTKVDSGFIKLFDENIYEYDTLKTKKIEEG